MYEEFAGLEVLTEVVTILAIFGDIAPFSPYVHRRYEKSMTSILRIKINRARNQRTAVVSSETSTDGLHDAVSQEIATFVLKFVLKFRI
jgi:enterochelin esterase-like enzyme